VRRTSIFLFEKYITEKGDPQRQDIRRLSRSVLVSSVRKLITSQLWKFPGRSWLVNDTMIITANQNTIKGTRHEAAAAVDPA